MWTKSVPIMLTLLTAFGYEPCYEFCRPSAESALLCECSEFLEVFSFLKYHLNFHLKVPFSGWNLDEMGIILGAGTTDCRPGIYVRVDGEIHECGEAQILSRHTSIAPKFFTVSEHLQIYR